MSDTRRLNRRAGQFLSNLQNRQPIKNPSFNRDAAEHSSRLLVLVGVFFLLLMELAVIIVAWLFLGVQIETVKDMAAIILSPTFTLFGTIVGFYFSRRD